MNAQDNDHIEVHSINGFIANDIHGALQEIYAVSRATNSRQFMFSMSLSPPEDANVSIEDYEDAIQKSIKAVGLEGQPHVVLFHEKNVRRHCHVVISRIDTDHMKAINLPFYKDRLNEVARDLFLQHEWDLPKGFQDKSLSNPLNYTLEEYQVAKRAKRDPREIKAVLKECWQQSDSKKAFEAALEQKGFYLCRGDRRGFVVLDWQNKVYSLSRWVNQKTKALKERLGDPQVLPSIEETETKISQILEGKQEQFISEINADFETKIKPLLAQKERITKAHREERQQLLAMQKQRQEKEALERSKRFRKGLISLWDWLSGQRRKIQRKNEIEFQASRKKCRQEYQALINNQRENRKQIQRKIEKVQAEYEKTFSKVAVHTTHSQKLEHLYADKIIVHQHEEGLEIDYS